MVDFDLIQVAENTPPQLDKLPMFSSQYTQHVNINIIHTYTNASVVNYSVITGVVITDITVYC